MRKGQPISHSKPSPAQVNLLTTAVTNNGYLTADLATGRAARTYQACADRGWMTADHRITFAGRDVLRRHDTDAYAKALPAAHVDIELNRIAARFTGQPTAPLGGPLGSPAHVLAIPDTLIQYDIEPGVAKRFIGYHINTPDGLRMIANVWYDYDGEWIRAARIMLSDDKGGMTIAGHVSSEFQVYGPAGGPDLRKNAADLLDRTRRVHEDMQAGQFLPATPAPDHTNPDTERADTIVTTDNVAQLDNAFAGATGSTYTDRMPDVPLTIEAIQVAFDNAAQQMQDRQAALRQHDASIDAEPPMIHVVEEVYTHQTTGSGKSETVARLIEIVKAGGYTGTFIIDPKGDFPWPAQHADPEMIGQLPDTSSVRMAPNHGPVPLSPAVRARMDEQREKMQAGLSVNAATPVRLTPAVNPGELRDLADQVRDAIVNRVGDLHGIAGPVDQAGYRLCLLTARIATSNEAARDALMKLETALSEIERGATNVARVILNRARLRLGRR